MPRSRPLLGLLFGLALVGLLELGCRLAAPAELPEARAVGLDPHPTRIWSLGLPGPVQPGLPTYRLDDDGLRAPQRSGPPRAPLLLTLGDSSMFGDGLEDGATLHDRIRVALVESGKPVRVRTAAVPGYSLLQTSVLMAELGWSLEPDLLVVGSMWSDCSQDQWRDEELLALMGSPAADVERRLAASALFTALRRGLNRALGRPTAWHISWPRPGDRGRRRVPLARYAELLQDLLDEAQRRGVGVLLLTLADLAGIEEPPEAAATCEPYVEVQRQVARSRGIPRVDARAVYRRTGLSADQLLWDRLHPAPAAAEALSLAVVEALLTEGWPRRRPVPGPALPLTLPEDPEDGRADLHPGSVQREIAVQ